MRAELGVGESGLERVIHGAWELLDLISFFTADTDKEAMARAIPAGSTAHEAAGKVHTDIQQRFVRAEVIGWGELVEAGGLRGRARSGADPDRGSRLRGPRRRSPAYQALGLRSGTRQVT